MKFKKTLAIILCAILMAFPLASCKDKDEKTKITLSEVTHSIFYAPLYVAINNGYFDEVNISLKLINGAGADKVMSAIASKSADIGLMGPEATVYCHVEGQKDYPVIFGQLTKRDGSFLVGKKAEPDFRWADTVGKHILAGRAGGMPAMTLQYVMNKAGVDTNTPLFDTSVEFGVMAAAFENSDKYDYCTMFEPVASDCVARGKGFVVASIGKDSGDVPYTAFSAKKSFINENKEVVTNFLRAVIKGYNFMINSAPADVAKALEKSFPSTSLKSIEASVVRYRDIDAWASTPVMKKADFELLQDIMENAGKLDTRADYSVAVDNSIAEIVANDLL